MESICSRSLSHSISTVVFLLFLLSSWTNVSAADLVVTNTADSGSGSLRSAIVRSLHTAESDIISFELSIDDARYRPVEGRWDIRLFSPLPPLTEPGLQIAGVGAADGSRIKLMGGNTEMSAEASGLVVRASDISIENLGIEGFPAAGIVIDDKNGSVQNVQLRTLWVERNGYHEDIPVCRHPWSQGGVVITGGVSHVTIDHVKLSHNNCVGIAVQKTSELPTDVRIVNGLIRETSGVGVRLTGRDHTIEGVGSSVLFRENSTGAIEAEEGDGLAVRHVAVESSVPAAQQVKVADWNRLTIENLSVVAPQSAGIKLEEVSQFELSQVSVADLSDFGLEIVGSTGMVTNSSIDYVDGVGVWLSPTYTSDQTMPSYVTLQDVEFADMVSTAVRNEQSCLVHQDTNLRSHAVQFSKPFLLSLDASAVEAELLPPYRVFVDGGSLSLVELKAISKELYGLPTSNIGDQETWPAVTQYGRSNASLLVSVQDAAGQLFTGKVKLPLEGKCLSETIDPEHIVPADNMHLVVISTSSAGELLERDTYATPATIFSEPTVTSDTGTVVRSHWWYAAVALVAIVSWLLMVALFGKKSVGLGKLLGDVVSLFRDRSVFFAGAQFVVNGLNYVFVLIMAAVLTQDLFAAVNTVLALFFIAAIPTFLLQDFVTNQFSVDFQRLQVAQAVSVFTRWIICFMAVASVPVLLFAQPIAAWLELPWVYAIWLLLLANMLNYLLPLPRGVMQARQQFVQLGIHLVVEAAVKLGLFFLLLWVEIHPFLAVVLAIVGGYVVSIVWLYVMLSLDELLLVERNSRQVRARTTAWLKQSFLQTGVYFLVTIASFGILSNIDLIVVYSYFSEEAPAYGVAARIAQLVIFGAMSISIAHLPGFYLRTEDAALQVLWRPMALIVFGVVSFFILLVTVGSDIIVWLFGEDFRSSYPLLVRLSVSASCIALALPVTYFLLSRRAWLVVWLIAPLVGFFVLVATFGSFATLDGFVAGLLLTAAGVLVSVSFSFFTYCRCGNGSPPPITS